MNEKNTKATENVEIDPGMSVMPEEPGLMDVPTVIPELDSVLAAMPTALPAYQTTTWKNKPSTETPVDAAVMTRVEQRLVDLTTAVNGLRDSVSRVKFQKKAWAKTIEIEMSDDSFALCLCGNSVIGIWRSTYDVFLSDMPTGVTNEKTSTGVRLTRTTGETGWLAIVYR